ncbi:Unknown protein [Striga hermonthica]|uniref:Conserved oligomeric Golgi complex subunit 6 n=1 Tax=Striga hermonthica TaxID=68872 RepID=A0A9N7N0T5_STRHE|nr:Unknown protein [Striga hermonthica]
MEITVPKTHTKPRLPLHMKSTPYKTPPPNPPTQLQLPLHRPEHKPPKPIRTGNPKTRPVTTTSDVLRLMDSLRFPVPLDIYALLVGECAESGDPSKAVELHDHVRRSRLRLGVGMLNRIMLMHVSCGSLAHARQVFDQMLVTDFNSWAVVIAACVENGEYDEAIELFVKMLRGKGFKNVDDKNQMCFSVSGILVCVLRACLQTMKFELGVQALDQVEEEVNALAECCDKIAKALNNCNATTGDIISTTERLKQELENTTQRQEIASFFLRDYQLSNDEINALREEELSENFFKALAHVHEIHANCKLLLRTHHQRAGLELMDMMAVYQEGAYERLCRWVQAECRRLGDFDNPEVNELLRTAVRCLKARPVLFKYCAEEVANMRHNALFRRFISALTRGGPGGLPRPIEVHAHDPLRYVGDMLGWLHQALASERELVLALLDPDSVADTGPIAQRFSKIPESDSGKADSDLTFVLDRIFEGVCRPFKVRVEQVLQSQPSLIISYKLTITLEFYSHTISDLLGRETALCNTLWALKDAAQKTFFDIVKARGEKLLRYPPLVAVDLSPPPALREGVSVLLELIETYDSMMVPVSGEKPAFEPVISALLDPIIQMCEQAAEAHKSKGAIQSSRRNRVGSDPAQLRRSSIDAILDNSSSSSSFQVYIFACFK